MDLQARTTVPATPSTALSITLTNLLTGGVVEVPRLGLLGLLLCLLQTLLEPPSLVDQLQTVLRADLTDPVVPVDFVTRNIRMTSRASDSGDGHFT